VSPLKLISNFFKNAWLLTRMMSSREFVDWGALAKTISPTCEIDPEARINGRGYFEMSKVGRGTYIARNAWISHADIGKFCSIGPNFSTGLGIHPVDTITSSPVFYSMLGQAAFTLSKSNKIEERKRVNIGNDVFIGANVTVLDGVTIGDGAVIGAGAVVSKDIPPYAIAVGIPIRIIRYRFSEETIAKLLESKWWDGDAPVLDLVEKHFFEVDRFVEVIDTKVNTE